MQLKHSRKHSEFASIRKQQKNLNEYFQVQNEGITSANQEQLQNCQDHGKTKNEESRSLVRLFIGRNYVSKFRDKLFEDENLKTMKVEEIGPGSTRACAQGMELCYHAPRAFKMRLGHMQQGICASSICHTPQAYENAGEQSSFSSFFWVQPAFLAQTQLEILHYKYQSSLFIISRSELWQFKRKATLELRERIHLLLYFLRYVFIFGNLFLVTMCN